MQRVVANGIGLECASLGEVFHSKGLKAKHIIFDSPCKSKADLRYALFENEGIYVNLDNENEFEDLNELVAEFPDVDLSGRVGLRINPVVGLGKIESVSTAARGSKFGLPLVDETRERILNLYEQNKWLQGVHIHVGSQGCSMDQLTLGATTLMKFVAELESRGVVVKVLDIGGGMPTSYTESGEAHTFASYRALLDKAVPQLFSGKYRVMTEFGRCVLTKPGITVSRIAAVKGAPYHAETPLAVAHVGSNQFVREAYLPEVWRHRFTALNADGKAHTGADDLRLFDVCGPLCFQGDYLIKKHPLPSALKANDVLCIHDTGGYTLAMYSKYNSRQAGPVYGFRKTDGAYTFVVLKERETEEETLKFWGPAEPKAI